MKLATFYILIAVILQLSQAAAAAKIPVTNELNNYYKNSSAPTKPCTKDNEGESVYHLNNSAEIWICINKLWKAFGLTSQTGKTKALSGDSCKHIVDSLSGTCAPVDGLFWIQDMQVYCDMTTDGGGWTLVWQHTYMKHKTLHENMFYYSNYYQPCNKNFSHPDLDWCNIPNKSRFNPTEQMVVAYHKGTMIFAYKGLYNCNIDDHWIGAWSFDYTKLVDKCVYNNGKPPSPSVHHSGIFGLNFDKVSPTNYNLNCNTYHKGSNLTSPNDCRWRDCHLPSTIASKKYDTDMTMGIYVR